MDVETWCAQNNIIKANYYYRLRRVRKACLDQMQTALAAGIKLFGDVSEDADEAVNALINETLDYNPEVKCSHHEHNHEEGHACGEHGCGSHSCH